MADTPRRRADANLPAARGTVQSVERTLDLLECLAQTGESGIGQLSSRVGLHASTVHRLLATLIARGYVRQNPESGRYLLGLKPLDVARAVREHQNLRMEAVPILRDLMQQTGETANLAVLDGHEIVYLEQVSSPGWMLRMFVQVGARAPLHSTASGKVLLAHLPETELRRLLSCYPLTPFAARTIVDPGVLFHEIEEVRRQGFATDYGEQEEGVSCIAGPVRESSGRVVAAISVSGPWIRITPARVPSLVPPMRQACARLSAALGYSDGGTAGRGDTETRGRGDGPHPDPLPKGEGGNPGPRTQD